LLTASYGVELKSDLGGGEEDNMENEKEGHKESLRERLRFNTMMPSITSWW
jgi:hypothetical protein